MRKDHHSRIFDLFFTHTRIGQGTGLGLTVTSLAKEKPPQGTGALIHMIKIPTEKQL